MIEDAGAEFEVGVGRTDLSVWPRMLAPYELMRRRSLIAMTTPTGSDEIVGLLVATAKAHHAATGGVNPQWARWYAEHLVDDLNRALHAEMDIDALETWLSKADRRYRSHPQKTSWPKAYAAWLRSEFE